MQKYFTLLVFGLILALSKADQHDGHDGHAKGSQGGNVDITEKNYKLCADGKATCIGVPENCHQQHKNCKFMVAIMKPDQSGNEHEHHSGYLLSLFGEKTNGYVAVGISEKGDKMQDSLIFQCRSDKQGVEATWSKYATRPEKLDNDDQHFVNQIENVGSIGQFQGKLACEFIIPSKFTVMKKDFDLDAKKYKILLAQGALNGEYIAKHEEAHLSGLVHFAQIGSSSSSLSSSYFIIALLSAYAAWL